MASKWPGLIWLWFSHQFMTCKQTGSGQRSVKPSVSLWRVASPVQDEKGASRRQVWESEPIVRLGDGTTPLKSRKCWYLWLLKSVHKESSMCVYSGDCNGIKICWNSMHTGVSSCMTMLIGCMLQNILQICCEKGNALNTFVSNQSTHSEFLRHLTLFARTPCDLLWSVTGTRHVGILHRNLFLLPA